MKKFVPILTIGLVLSSISACSDGKSPSKKSGKVEVGMSKTEVMKALGDPSVTNASEGKWYYYDSSFMKKYNKMNAYYSSDNEADWIRGNEIYEQLLQMKVKCHFVRFSLENERVSEYFYNTNYRYERGDYASWEAKLQKSLGLEGLHTIDVYRSNNTFSAPTNEAFKYEVTFTDKSVYRSIVSLGDMYIANTDNQYSGTWNVSGFTSFATTLNLNVYDAYIRIQYDANKSTVTGSGLYNIGNTVTLSSQVGLGYESDGWYSPSGDKLTSNFSYSFEVESTGLHSYMFLTKSIGYTITYNLDGGTNSANNPSKYTIDNEVQFSEPSKTGYEFTGWYDNNGNRVEKISKGSMGDITLTARWELIYYHVKYLDENGGLLYEGSASYFDGIPEYPSGTPTKASTEELFYVFDGWDLVEKDGYSYVYQAEFHSVNKNQYAYELADSICETIFEMLSTRYPEFQFSNMKPSYGIYETSRGSTPTTEDPKLIDYFESYFHYRNSNQTGKDEIAFSCMLLSYVNIEGVSYEDEEETFFYTIPEDYEKAFESYFTFDAASMNYKDFAIKALEFLKNYVSKSIDNMELTASYTGLYLNYYLRNGINDTIRNIVDREMKKHFSYHYEGLYANGEQYYPNVAWIYSVSLVKADPSNPLVSQYNNKLVVDFMPLNAEEMGVYAYLFLTISDDDIDIWESYGFPVGNVYSTAMAAGYTNYGVKPVSGEDPTDSERHAKYIAYKEIIEAAKYFGWVFEDNYPKSIEEYYGH